MLKLHYHPFAQYCQKVLIALYEHDLPFERVIVDLGDPAQRAALTAVWPFTKFPAIETGNGTILGESGVIVEYLDSLAPNRTPLVPDDRIEGIEPRMLERVIDNFIADPLTRMVIAAFTGKPSDEVDRETIATAYDFLESRLSGREWGAGSQFGLADCTAGPALFYANLYVPIGDRPLLADWFARLRARPTFARVIDEARPYRTGTPFEWPAGY